MYPAELEFDLPRELPEPDYDQILEMRRDAQIEEDAWESRWGTTDADEDWDDDDDEDWIDEDEEGVNGEGDNDEDDDDYDDEDWYEDEDDA